MLSGHQVHTLNSEQIQSVVLGKCSIWASTRERVYVLHDGCDIRKSSSSDLEHLGKVMSLDKQVVGGYESMNSVAIDPHNQSLELVFDELYSNRHPNFVSQQVLSKPTLASPHQSLLIATAQAINTQILYKKSIKESHKALKSSNQTLQLTHISDREFDDEACFEYIDQLGDEFITRLKLSRLSNETQPRFTPKGKVSKRSTPVKLIDKKTFAHQSEYCLIRVAITNKKYHKVTVRMEWETLNLNQKTYSVLRTTLFNSDKKAIFTQPRLLITNRNIDLLATAIEIYRSGEPSCLFNAF